MTTPPADVALAVVRFLSESGLFGIAVVDETGTVEERLGALTADLGVGARADEAFPFLTGLEDDLAELAAGSRSHMHIPNMNLTLSDGRELFVSVFLASGPRPETWTVVMQDTSDASRTHRRMMQQRNELDIARRQLEEANDQLRERGVELEQARRRAEEATEAKSRFLAMMTHEIRTPMNGVLGMLQLMDDGTLDHEKRAYATTARSSAEALLQIIGDILDFSKIEAGRLEIERIPFDPRRLCADVIALLRPRAEEKGIFLEWSANHAIPDAVIGDPNRCRQVLLNLIGNAIKFTSEGGVTLSLGPEDEGSENLRFTVSDTGIGIPEDARDRLFQEFTQTDSSTTRKYGGTGLGLAISKQLVVLMGGQIGVDSVEGEGSTFWCSLPLEATERAPVPDEQDELPEPVRGARILVADDTAGNRQVAIAMLSRAGYLVETAEDGREAVDRVLEGAHDLVLMDVNMPELDGFAATARLREAGVSLPIVAMTAHAEAALGEDHGFDAYLSKPVRRDELLRAVANLLMAKGVQPGVEPSGRQEPRSEGTQPDAPLDSLLDHEVLSSFREDVGGEVFGTLVDTYLSETRTRVDDLVRLWDEGAYEVLERYAHDIKTCAGSLGAGPLRDEAAALEKAAAQGDEPAVERLVDAVVETARRSYAPLERARDRLTP